MYDKAKLLVVRDNIDRYLKKAEEKEKDRYSKLALSFKNSQLTIDKILDKLQGDKGFDKLAILLVDLKKELSKAVKSPTIDLSPLLSEIKTLGATMMAKKEYTDDNTVKGLAKIEKLLSKKPPKVKDGTENVVKAIESLKMPEKVEFPESISIDNFPPQKYPLPVTSININPLRGLIHTTAATVSTTLTALPTYGVLENRRSIMLFNNESSRTIYVGGSDVTTSNGIPVLAQTYSPVVDAGVRMILYAVTSSGTADIRVIEISNDAIGG